jgi:hypothetical protein
LASFWRSSRATVVRLTLARSANSS